MPTVTINIPQKAFNFVKTGYDNWQQRTLAILAQQQVLLDAQLAAGSISQEDYNRKTLEIAVHKLRVEDTTLKQRLVRIMVNMSNPHIVQEFQESVELVAAKDVVQQLEAQFALDHKTLLEDIDNEIEDVTAVTPPTG